MDWHATGSMAFISTGWSQRWICCCGVELAVHISRVNCGNGIMQWTNCKLELVYRDPVAWNPLVDPSFRPLSRCRPSHSVWTLVHCSLDAARNSGCLSNEDLLTSHWIAMNELATSMAKRSVDRSRGRPPTFHYTSLLPWALPASYIAVTDAGYKSENFKIVKNTIFRNVFTMACCK